MAILNIMRSLSLEREQSSVDKSSYVKTETRRDYLKDIRPIKCNDEGCKRQMFRRDKKQWVAFFKSIILH